jgi:hypothetical protein
MSLAADIRVGETVAPLLRPPGTPVSAQEAGSGQADASLQGFLTVDQATAL